MVPSFVLNTVHLVLFIISQMAVFSRTEAISFVNLALFSMNMERWSSFGGHCFTTCQTSALL